MPDLRNSTVEDSTGRARRAGPAALRHEVGNAPPIQLGAWVDDLFEAYLAWCRAHTGATRGRVGQGAAWGPGRITAILVKETLGF
jgi:hypothetical protein